MLSWGFGFALVAIATLLLTASGVPGLGPVAVVTLTAAILLFAGAVVTWGDHRNGVHGGPHGRLSQR